MTKVTFCTPTIAGPFPAYKESLAASVPLIEAAGFQHHTITFEVGSAYISHARATMLRRALNADAEIIVFLDHDLGWAPDALVKLLKTEGDVAAGTYRYKDDKEQYMGTFFSDGDGHPFVRTDDGALRAECVPAGFLKVTRKAVEIFARAYPDLLYGSVLSPDIDLFNHGAHKGVWWGEDYAFCRRWCEAGGDIWLAPDLDISHHTTEKSYPGNYYRFMRNTKSAQAAPLLDVA